MLLKLIMEGNLRINFFISESADHDIYHKLVTMNKFVRAEFIRDCIRHGLGGVCVEFESQNGGGFSPHLEKQSNAGQIDFIDVGSLRSENEGIKFE